MSRILRTLESKQDYLDIWTFIATDNEAAADRVVERFDAALHLLANAPGLGPRREEFGVGVRSFLVGQYLIFYRAIDDGIELLRVLHGARDLRQVVSKPDSL